MWRELGGKRSRERVEREYRDVARERERSECR